MSVDALWGLSGIFAPHECLFTFTVFVYACSVCLCLQCLVVTVASVCECLARLQKRSDALKCRLRVWIRLANSSNAQNGI